MLLSLLKKVGSARLRESDITLSVRRPQPHNTNLQTERREGKQYSTKQYRNSIPTIVGIEQLRPIKKHQLCFLNPPVPHHRIIPQGHREGNKSPDVLQGSAARRFISVPMCDFIQSTASNPHWHIRSRQNTIKRVHRFTPDLIKIQSTATDRR